MKKELTPEQVKYLKDRGFQIIEGKPLPNEPFPYVTLREPQHWLEQSEMTYHKTSSTSSGTADVSHPKTVDKGELVALIERAVAGSMGLEGKLFNTQVGKPIKIYIIDPAWKEVAEAVTAKYK